LALRGGLEAEADADMVDQVLADRQLAAKAASQKDARRAVGARGEHDRSGCDLPAVGVHEHVLRVETIDERIREDAQVGSVARGIEVGEAEVPAYGADRVYGMDAAGASGLGEHAVPWRELRLVEYSDPHLPACSL